MANGMFQNKKMDIDRHCPRRMSNNRKNPNPLYFSSIIRAQVKEPNQTLVGVGNTYCWLVTCIISMMGAMGGGAKERSHQRGDPFSDIVGITMK